MSLVSTIISNARVLLQDTSSPYRYADDTLLVYANEAMQQAIARRPDLIFGSYAIAWADKRLIDTFPFISKYEAPVTDYVVFRANIIDQEDAAMQRGAAFNQLFQGLL